jgi:hypothetical protein
MKNTENAGLAIVVASRDESRDLWDPLFTLFRKHWPDCPFPVYLVSNTASYRDMGVSTILVGPDKSWSDTLLAGLKQLTQSHVLLWIDDHFLTDPVEALAVEGSINACLQLGGNYLRLHALPQPDEALNNHFGIIRKGAVYRTAVVASVWKRKVLQDLLRPGESAWEFETAGAARSDQYDGFFSTWRTWFEIENLLIRGRIRPAALRRIERHMDHKIDLCRPTMSPIEEARFVVKNAGNRALVKLPRRFAKRVRNAVLRIRTP